MIDLLDAITIGAAASGACLAFLLWMFVTTQRRTHRMAHRLEMLSAPDAGPAPRSLPALTTGGDNWINSRWGAHLARLVAIDDVYEGQQFSLAQLTSIASIAGGIALIGLWRFMLLAFPLAFAGAVLILLLCLRLLVAIERRQSERALIAQLPDAIDMIVRMVRTGMAVSVAIRTASPDLPPPLGGIFRKMADEAAIGVPFDQVLGAMAQRVRRPEFRFFAIAASLQHATGGNLTTTLENMADMMRRRRAMYLKAKAMVSEVRMSALLLSILPFVSAGVLLVTKPDYLAPLLYDRRGNLLLGGAVLGVALGAASMYGLMRRNLRI